MSESPIFGRLGLQLVINPQLVGEFNFAKSVKVELPDEGGEFIMFEELGYDASFEELSVFDDEC